MRIHARGYRHDYLSIYKQRFAGFLIYGDRCVVYGKIYAIHVRGSQTGEGRIPGGAFVRIDVTSADRVE